MAEKHEILDGMTIGRVREIIDELADAVSEKGGTYKHLTQIIENDILAREIADLLITIQIEPYERDFEVTRDTVSDVLADGDYRILETQSTGFHEWMNSVSEITLGRRKAVLLQVKPPTTSLARSFNRLRKELDRHGLRGSTTYELLSFGVHHGPYLRERRIRVYGFEVSCDRIPSIKSEPNGKLTIAMESPHEAANDADGYFLAIEN